jgi:hypothetical protein
MWSTFYRILKIIAKYGKRAVDWCWANRQRIFDWIARGYTVDQIVQFILRALGLA